MIRSFTRFGILSMLCASMLSSNGIDNIDNNKEFFISVSLEESVEDFVSTKRIEVLTDTSLRLGTKNFTSKDVNVRKDKSKNSDIITTLRVNTDVVVYWSHNGWSYVCFNKNSYGYIKSNYLSKKTTPVNELNRWGIDLKKEEKELLAKIVFLEANLEPYKGQVAVVECIFNRMLDGSWGETLYDVLSSPGQFTSWKNRNIAKPTKTNYKAIRDVLRGKTEVIGLDYLYFSRGGHKTHDSMLQIGNHQFCKEG